MTGNEFTAWIEQMKSIGLASSDAECGRLIGKSPDTIVRMKKNGTSKTVDLACAAALHGLELWHSRIVVVPPV